MGQLPAARVTPTRVFNRVGVDFCGPFEIKNFTGRSKQLEEVRPAEVYSDNGNAVLIWCQSRIKKVFLKSLFKFKSAEEIQNYMANEGVKWFFNLPTTLEVYGNLVSNLLNTI
ncbi:hypothetical protein CEXT_57211 [Caerostris extrusa]|uniref:Uncharacterized protein n=1 Tax=Caerostris extrusa TaxID=172846 RepID=A0AAV4MEB6_CAEEX|nr:hypothetical protein CEXT_57211 [Caerostris extrusa]